MSAPTAEQRAALAAVVEENLAAIDRLGTRITRIDRGADYGRLAGVAYALHNVYNALENVFEQVSRTFENHVVDRGQWHKELLGKLFLEIRGVRPPLLQSAQRDFLNDLRSFRHLFRHAYDFELDADKLDTLAQHWAEHGAAVRLSLRRFSAWLLEPGDVT